MVRYCRALVELDVEFVEQPVPAEHPDGLKYVYDRSPLPIVADESCPTAGDVPAIADRCDIANLKLMKTGGLSVSGPGHRLTGSRFEDELPSLLLGTAIDLELNIAHS